MVDNQVKEVSEFEKDFTQQSGLNEKQVAMYTQRYGSNEVTEKEVGLIAGTLKRMWDPISWLLEAAIIFEFF